jgi:glutathione S-transferase
MDTYGYIAQFSFLNLWLHVLSTTFVALPCRKFALPVDVHMIRLDKGEHKKADYLQINPLGKVRRRVHLLCLCFI